MNHLPQLVKHTLFVKVNMHSCSSTVYLQNNNDKADVNTTLEYTQTLGNIIKEDDTTFKY